MGRVATELPALTAVIESEPNQNPPRVAATIKRADAECGSDLTGKSLLVVALRKEEG